MLTYEKSTYGSQVFSIVREVNHANIVNEHDAWQLASARQATRPGQLRHEYQTALRRQLHLERQVFQQWYRQSFERRGNYFFRLLPLCRQCSNDSSDAASLSIPIKAGDGDPKRMLAA
ncbi:hypothetical protein DES52_1028 [Deinococcus yavapaiensis KR-236]|uniref:Uncharacterized protein n=1 Tax=Deinococcus yavapaiensis KR-236 TaxID=694435 RepID=A0A318SEI9_9DEIO|nr:hypothetical protein DES52_1028 [Deinococcus yavapaiensis KR-236]